MIKNANNMNFSLTANDMTTVEARNSELYMLSFNKFKYTLTVELLSVIVDTNLT